MLKTRKNQYTTRENDIDFATLNQYHVTRDDTTVVGRSLAVILQDEMGMDAKQRKRDLVSQRIDAAAAAAAAAECCIACGRPKRRSHFLIYIQRIKRAGSDFFQPAKQPATTVKREGRFDGGPPRPSRATEA